MKLLNLGCGEKYHKDWINIDFVSNSPLVMSSNLLDGIPLNDSSSDVIYHSHVLEHFSKLDGYNFILECHRFLKKNGIIRIAVPDLEGIVREYLKNLESSISNDKQAQSNYNWIMLELFDQMVRTKSGGDMVNYLRQTNIPNENYVYNRLGSEAKKIREPSLKTLVNKNFSLKSYLKIAPAKIKKLVFNSIFKKEQKEALKIGKFRSSGEIHQWMYDRYSLSSILNKAGFKQIKVCSAYESRIIDWEKYELDVIDGVIRKPDSLYIEAIKL